MQIMDIYFGIQNAFILFKLYKKMKMQKLICAKPMTQQYSTWRNQI